MGKSFKDNQSSKSNHHNHSINFSFQYYDGTKYCLSSWEKGNISQTLKRLKDISCKSFNELMASRKVYHFGEVDWSKTIEKEGFTHNEKVRTLPAFHFALLGINNQKARVFGAFANGTFYIVWFDLEHAIWPIYLKNT